MKKSIIATLTIGAIFTVVSCKDSFLDQTPTAALSGATLATQKGVEGLLIGAYSELSGESNVNFYGGVDNWLWGGVRGGDATLAIASQSLAGTVRPLQRPPHDRPIKDAGADAVAQ